MKLKLLTITALVSLIFISCKKDSNGNSSGAYPIQGLWIGTYTVNGQPGLGQQYFSFIIKPDGTMINDGKAAGGQQHLAIGTWALNGTSFTSSFTGVYGPSSIGVVINVTATWDNKGELVSGIWTNAPPDSGSGTFTMQRVN